MLANFTGRHGYRVTNLSSVQKRTGPTFWRKRKCPKQFQAMPTNELEDRRRGLQSYLVALSELKDSWSSPAVTSVLCVEDDKPGEADGNGDTSTVEVGFRAWCVSYPKHSFAAVCGTIC